MNAGCGQDTWGDVRLDYNIDHYITGKRWDRKKIDVRGDIQHLPFKDDAFSLVRCWHVLEHIPDPQRGVNELARVAEHGDIRFPVYDGWKREVFSHIVSLGFLSPIFWTTLYRGWRGIHLWTIHPNRGRVSHVPWITFFRMGKKRGFPLFKKIDHITSHLTYRYEWIVTF